MFEFRCISVEHPQSRPLRLRCRGSPNCPSVTAPPAPLEVSEDCSTRLGMKTNRRQNFLHRSPSTSTCPSPGPLCGKEPAHPSKPVWGIMASRKKPAGRNTSFPRRKNVLMVKTLNLVLMTASCRPARGRGRVRVRRSRPRRI